MLALAKYRVFYFIIFLNGSAFTVDAVKVHELPAEYAAGCGELIQKVSKALVKTTGCEDYNGEEGILKKKIILIIIKESNPYFILYCD